MRSFHYALPKTIRLRSLLHWLEPTNELAYRATFHESICEIARRGFSLVEPISSDHGITKFNPDAVLDLPP